jgi:hypothetical protein
MYQEKSDNRASFNRNRSTRIGQIRKIKKIRKKLDNGQNCAIIEETAKQDLNQQTKTTFKTIIFEKKIEV